MISSHVILSTRYAAIIVWIAQLWSTSPDDNMDRSDLSTALDKANCDMQLSIKAGDLEEIDAILLPFRALEGQGCLIPEARETFQYCSLLAMDRRKFDIAKKLFEMGVHVHKYCGSPAIRHALETGTTEILETLLEHGWEIYQALNILRPSVSM